MRYNLLCMIVTTSTSSFNYYFLLYLANSFKQVYVTALALSLADIVAFFCGGVLVQKIGVSKTLASSFVLSAVGGFLILAFGLNR